MTKCALCWRDIAQPGLCGDCTANQARGASWCVEGQHWWWTEAYGEDYLLPVLVALPSSRTECCPLCEFAKAKEREAWERRAAAERIRSPKRRRKRR